MRNLLRVALEEASDGKAFREIEHTFYGRLEDIEQLKQAASSEHQEQWELKFEKSNLNGGEGRLRIRKTIADDKTEYVLTCKTNVPGTQDRIEVPVPTTEPMFQQFKLLAEKGMVKDRYFYPVEGTDLVWEIDMFYLPGAEVGSGKYCDWCKIDLEVKDRETPLPELPLDFAELIMAEEGNRTEDEEKRVRELYDNVFTAKNPAAAQ